VASPVCYRFSSAAGLVGAGFAAGVGVGDALDDVAANTTSHGETVAHGRDVKLAVIGTNGLSDVVGPFVGINDLGVFKRLTLSPQTVGSCQCMAKGGFIAGCSVLIDPNDSYPIDEAGGCRGYFSGGGQLSFELVQGLGRYRGGLSCGSTFVSAGVLCLLAGILYGVLGVPRSYLVDEVSKANNLGMLAMPMIRGGIIRTMKRPARKLVSKCSVST